MQWSCDGHVMYSRGVNVCCVAPPPAASTVSSALQSDSSKPECWEIVLGHTHQMAHPKAQLARLQRREREVWRRGRDVAQPVLAQALAGHAYLPEEMTNWVQLLEQPVSPLCLLLLLL